MHFSIQPTLENDTIILYPLQESDFGGLYAVASDPKIWEQHPNKDRWKKEIFRVFFDGAMESRGAFKVMDKNSGNILGSTRYYDYNEEDDSILIGYTFFSRECWGKGINSGVKKLMLDYIFQYVSKVYFHVGSGNLRSQIAVGRIGAVKVGEQDVAYFGEAPKLNFVYVIDKQDYKGLRDF